MSVTDMPNDDATIAAVREIAGAAGVSARITPGFSGECIVHLDDDEIFRLVPALATWNFVLIGLFATPVFKGEGYMLRYVFSHGKSILVFQAEITGKRAASVATIYPSASWPERECRDMYGIEFEGAFDTRRLVLHEVYPAGFHPLEKAFANAPVSTLKTIDPADEYIFQNMHGDGVYQVPVGPVHAGIIEPGHFRFSVIGETVFNLEVRLFYTHRGIEKLAEGKDPAECVRVAEAVSGDESAANATGYCMAVERLSGIFVPDQAWHIRTILCESERICSHLGDLGGMLTDVAFALGASQFTVLREEIFREHEKMTGSRFLRGMICPGGVSRDIPVATLALYREYLERFKKQFRTGLAIVLSTSSVIDRFSRTGIIRKPLLSPLNITGPVARASGSGRDVRVDHPYGIYDRLVPMPRPLNDGDVLARFTVKAAEILDSISLIEKSLATMPDGPIRSTDPVCDGAALALVEGPRGENLCWVEIRNGTVWRYKVRTASYCNWPAIEHAAPGNIIADFPVINKSLNLSYAGTDL
ncbi:NADH-quinone oxidoreductase subunit C [Methanoregula sp.]|uniref:hydrogenase large subunit n=1 Tax=Methanoregula sp. TaxID=2052170 RepID=UPI002C42B523|nr:NADH-quinone oxidoreductase subunit C [Methanoregula sp.]HVP95948.1 NADH-quinone oxidoreductase subunit C [Methanoregula sp.]